MFTVTLTQGNQDKSFTNCSYSQAQKLVKLAHKIGLLASASRSTNKGNVSILSVNHKGQLSEKVMNFSVKGWYNEKN